MCALKCRVQQVTEPLHVASVSDSMEVNKISLVTLYVTFLQ
jgi:hypothetical protein